MAIAAPILLAESRDDREHRSFDVPGAVTVTAGLAILVYALVDANDAGWGSTQTVVLLAVALVLIGVFLAIELRQRSPLVPFSIFRLRTLSASNVIGLLLGASLFSMFFFVSLHMQNVLGFTPLETGLAYLPLSAGIIVSAGAASQVVTRLGVRPVLVGGLLLMPVMLGAVAGTQPSEAGLASGLINTSQQVGGALGLAILSTIAFDGIAESGRPDPVALTEGFGNAFLVGAVFALVAAGIAFFAIRRKDEEVMQEAAAQPVAA